MKDRIKKGFTLVEMVIVMGVIALVIPALFSIIFVIVQQQLKVYALQEVKRQGDNALVLMESIIRNYGSSIYDNIDATSHQFTTQVCFSETSPNNQYSSIKDGTEKFVIKDRFGNGLRYFLENEMIASEAASVLNNLSSTNRVFLTTDKVRVSSFVISCDRTALYSPPIINFSFNITHASIGYSINYQSKVKLKSY